MSGIFIAKDIQIKAAVNADSSAIDPKIEFPMSKKFDRKAKKMSLREVFNRKYNRSNNQKNKEKEKMKQMTINEKNEIQWDLYLLKDMNSLIANNIQNNNEITEIMISAHNMVLYVVLCVCMRLCVCVHVCAVYGCLCWRKKIKAKQKKKQKKK